MYFRKKASVLVLLMCVCVSSVSAKSKNLPPGIINALAGDGKDFCEQSLADYNISCHQIFQANLLWRELEVAPNGQSAFLVENHNLGSCGSAGCSLYLFVHQPDAKFVHVLGKNGDVGELSRVTILKTVSAGHYDIQKKWRDGKTRTIYRWDGERYSAQ